MLSPEKSRSMLSGFGMTRMPAASGRLEVREEGREDAKDRKDRTDLINKTEAGEVDKFSEQGRADSAHAKGEAKEQAGNGPDSPGHEFLGVNKDGGKGRSQDQADDDAEHAGPEKIGIRQQQCEGKNSENGDPDDVFAADFVAHGAANKSAGGDGAQKNEKAELGSLNRHVELGHEIKRVVAHQAGQVEKLRKHERYQKSQ